MSNLARYIAKRTPLRTQVTRISNDISSNLANLDNVTLLGYQYNLESYIVSLNSFDDLIWDEYVAADKDRDFMVNEETKNLEYLQKIQMSLAAIKTQMGVNTASQTAALSGSSSQPTSNNSSDKAPLRFSEVPLPTFSGEVTENLQSFFHNFETTLNITQTSNFQKFLLLKKCLTGEAAKLISAIKASDDAYDKCKAFLEKAYAPQAEQKFKVLDQLTKIRMDYNTHIFDHYSTMQEHFDAFDCLKIDIETIKRYFLWRSFNDSVRREFTVVCGEHCPTFAKLEKHKFEVAARYKDLQAKFNNKQNKVNQSSPRKESKETSSLAVNVTPREKTYLCHLCKDIAGATSNHFIGKCERFSTNPEKLDRLKQIKSCSKCAFGHKTEKCKFKFKQNCRHCEQPHYSFLCPNFESVNLETSPVNSQSRSDNASAHSDESGNSDDESGEAANICFTDVYQASARSNNILPTFSTTINNFKARGLRDTGSQQNYISKALVEKCNLQFKDNIKIVVNGLNTSRGYNTKTVILPLTLNNKTYSLEAVVVPEIPAKFNAHGLKEIALEFVEKGFKLADSDLVNSDDGVYELDLILGIDATHCFREVTKTFGLNDESVYFESTCGVMPVGNSLKMLTNLHYLPKLKSPLSVKEKQVEKLPNLTSPTHNNNIQLQKIKSEIALSVSAFLATNYSNSTCNLTANNSKCVISEDLTMNKITSYELGHLKNNQSLKPSKLPCAPFSNEHDLHTFPDYCTELHSPLITFDLANT